MARTETKNIVIARGPTQAANTTVSVSMNVGEDIQKNFHNIWMGMCVTPNDADANADGNWVLYLESLLTAPILDAGTANMNLETENFKIIACGCWHASNQTPWNFSESLGKTSRNIRQNGRLILLVRNEAITAGLWNGKVMLCAGSNTF